jgi:hypothetical protein
MRFWLAFIAPISIFAALTAINSYNARDREQATSLQHSFAFSPTNFISIVVYISLAVLIHLVILILR